MSREAMMTDIDCLIRHFSERRDEYNSEMTMYGTLPPEEMVTYTIYFQANADVLGDIFDHMDRTSVPADIINGVIAVLTEKLYLADRQTSDGSRNSRRDIIKALGLVADDMCMLLRDVDKETIDMLALEQCYWETRVSPSLRSFTGSL